MKCVPGYVDMQGTLRAKQAEWFGVYAAQGDNYESDRQVRVGDTQAREQWRLRSIHPAQMVCAELSGLIFNEGTRFSVSQSAGSDIPQAALDEANDRLQQWVIEEDYQTICNKAAEWSCALGTAAQVLQFGKVLSNGEVATDSDVSVLRYDARYIFPIAFTEDTVSDVAFTSLISLKDGWAVQVTRITRERDGWTIRNHWFDYSSSKTDIRELRDLDLADYAREVHVPGDEPPFAIMRPAGTNIYAANSCMGVSVFDGAVPACLLADRAFQNFLNDIELGQKMVFLDEDMIQGDRANRTLPFDIGKRLFVKVFRGIGGASSHIEEYNPSLRADENSKALSTALSVLGLRTGFGSQYWQFDKTARQIITATGEIMDQQALIRTITRHENSYCRPIQDMLSAMLHALGYMGAYVRLQYDDSVIIDSEHQKEQDRLDVAAGLMPAWRYVKEWRGVDDNEAREWIEESRLV